MVFLFALSLQSVSVMIPNKVKSKSINKLDSFYYEEDFTYSSSDARIGLAVGAEFEYQVTDIVSVSFGALYSMQGCKADDATVKLDYINVPLLANVYVARALL